MLQTIAVAGYLVLWLALREVALRAATPATAVRPSPWITRVALGYCFFTAAILSVTPVWSDWRPHDIGLIQISTGALLLVLALVADAACLRSLGSLYSLEMAVKQGHVVVRDGLYRFVRHPIYLSNIIGYLGVCLLLVHWIVWVGLAAQVAGFIAMARHEERFLVGHLGDVYEQYRWDVRWMLIPGVL